MLSATQLGSYTKSAPKQETTMLACTKCYSGQLALSLMVVTIGRGALMLQMHDVNVPALNLLAVESVFG